MTDYDEDPADGTDNQTHRMYAHYRTASDDLDIEENISFYLPKRSEPFFEEQPRVVLETVHDLIRWLEEHDLRVTVTFKVSLEEAGMERHNILMTDQHSFSPEWGLRSSELFSSSLIRAVNRCSEAFHQSSQ